MCVAANIRPHVPVKNQGSAIGDGKRNQLAAPVFERADHRGIERARAPACERLAPLTRLPIIEKQRQTLESAGRIRCLDLLHEGTAFPDLAYRYRSHKR